jgi:hypothetical protein
MNLHNSICLKEKQSWMNLKKVGVKLKSFISDLILGHLS